MRRFVFVFIFSLLSSLTFLWKLNIPTVKAPIPPIHQGDLIISDNNVYTIMGRFDINGSIIVEENATLILRNAIVNFTQIENHQFHMTFRNPADGNPRLIVENTSIITNDYDMDIYFDANSTAEINELVTSSSIDFLLYDEASVKMSNSSFYKIAAWNYTSAIVLNCTLNYLYAGDNSEVHSFDSMADMFISFGNSRLWVVNSTGGLLHHGQSVVYVYWYLDVHVIDLEGTYVPSANVTAKYLNSTIAETKLTEENGWTRLTLMQATVNASGYYIVENYTITGEYDGYSEQKSVSMFKSQEITIELEFIVPEFPSAIILPLFMIATLAVIVCKKKSFLAQQKNSNFIVYSESEVSSASYKN